MSALLIGLAALGLVVGLAGERVVSSYRDDGTPRPALLHGARPTVGRIVPLQATMAAAFVAVGLRAVNSPAALLLPLAEVALLVIVMFVDLATRLIPTALIGLLVALALAGAALGMGPGFGATILGGAVGFALFAVLVVLARVGYGAGALGMGDATLALAIGCVIGYPLVIPTLALGIVLGGLGALAIVGTSTIQRRPCAGLRATMPYGPYLASAAILMIAHPIAAPLHFPA